MSIYALPATLAFTANITLGLIVLLNNPRRGANRLFALFVFCFALWNAGEFAMITSKGLVGVTWGIRTILGGIFFSPAFFVHFSLLFPRKAKPLFSESHFLNLIYALPVVLLISVYSVSTIRIQRIAKLGQICYYSFSFYEPLVSRCLIPLLLLLALIYYSIGIKNLVHSLRKSHIARERLQIKYLIVGIATVFLIGFFIGLSHFLFTFGHPLFLLLGSSYTILISLFFAIAIVKYRLLDIPRLVKGSVLYFLISGLLLAIYVFVVKNIGEAISKAYGISSIFVEGLLIVLIVFLLRPLETKVRQVLDRFLYRETFRYRHRFLNFTRELASYTELKKLTRAVLDFLASSLRVEKVAFLLENENGSYETISTKDFHHKIFLDKNCLLSDHLKKVKNPVEWEEIGRLPIKKKDLNKLSRINTSMVLPLLSQDELLGMVLLGRRIDDRRYSQEEIEALSIFCNEIAIAMSRAQAIQEMKAREWELMQAEKLAALGKLSAGVAHEIRNPLGIISGSAETLLKKDHDPKTHREMLQFIIDETSRLNRVLTDFLKFARPKRPEFSRIHIVDIVAKTLPALTQRAHQQGVKIETSHRDKEIALFVDSEQMEQALLNLELNALEAMPKGGTLKIETLPAADDTLVIKIQDSGPGIPKEIQSRLFDPFFTTKPGGTGLGLSIAHRIIEEHGGKITFTPSSGGTTFIITLPTKRR